MPLLELHTAESQPGISSGRAALISCLNNCIQTGDNKILATFLDRLIGKPKEIDDINDETNVSPKDELIGQFVSMLFEKEKK